MKPLVEHLKITGVLKTPEIIEAFLAVDRKDFVVPEEAGYAYEDHAISIGYGQTISQPTTVAIMLELLDPKAGEKILDVGSGSGWTTALLAHIVGKDGCVIGLERVPELITFGQRNLTKYAFPNASIRATGDGLGLADEAPYDRMLVSAAAGSIPERLIRQLVIGGTMVIPISDTLVRAIRTSTENIDTFQIDGFAFVPLIDDTQ